ncbi:DUF368 domain-containing protein [Anaerorhabdus sp.]|uniref:DUF368 domain-containing protein n=1 Tax=Anaerorhabdus sp. TaxID=1872524 RepID=UPI002FC9272A
MEAIKYVVFGVLMGVANVIPGVSGGTIAIILNFYDRLMESITLNFKVIKRNLPFLLPLALGLAIGIVGLSKIMSFLLNNYTTQTYFGFIGIVLGSLPLIFYKAKGPTKKIKAANWIPFVIALGLMVYLAFMNGDKESAKAMIKYTSLNLESFVVCFISMAIATVTMIIPGISGSLILIIMGMYGTIYGFAIAEFNIPLLIPCGLGAVVGLLGGAKVVRWLLDKYEQLTYMAILGLLVGSFVQLYMLSGIVLELNATLLISLVVATITFVIIYWFSSQEMKRDKLETSSK